MHQNHQNYQNVHNNETATANHSKETISSQKIVAAAPLYIDREFRFSFKKQTIEDESGKQVKRPAIVLNIPVPTLDGLLESMSDPKVTSFILDLVENAIQAQVKTQLGDDTRPVMRQEDLRIEELNLGYLANMTKAERAGGGISKEDWEAFAFDYIEVMAPLRDQEKAERAAKLLVGRFNTCKTDKPVLKFLQEQLAIWAQHTKNLEDHQDIFVYLDNRASSLRNMDKTLLDAL